MSLRRRLLLAIAAALLASFLAGAWLSAWQAARLVRTELAAALETGVQGVSGTLQDLGREPPPAALARLVSSFDGSRHVLAEWCQGARVVERSRPARAARSPAWFTRLASPNLAPVELPAWAGATVRLSPLPASEIAERWSEARRLTVLLAVFSALTAAACLATVAISLRPLDALTDAFARLERGRGGAVAEAGPLEVRALAVSFNRMQEALALATHENRRLSAQLDRLAEEERAELARDLHDEVGPLLFAITAWAATARMQQEGGDRAAAGASLRALESVSAELQGAVRGLLRRLRDSAPGSTDLGASLEELLAFWRGIRPGIEFGAWVEASADVAPEAAKAALFRVAQESLSNAVRHGRPSRIRIRVACRDQGLALSVEDDGAGGGGGGGPGDGFGLVGMEERVQALGGTLDIRREGGWRVTAWAPIDPVARA